MCRELCGRCTSAHSQAETPPMPAHAVSRRRGRRFLVLVGSGATISEACRAVEISRREEPPRVTIMLTILFRGLVALGVSTRTARRIALRCAIDSIPLTRRRVLDALRAGEKLNTSELAVLSLEPGALRRRARQRAAVSRDAPLVRLVRAQRARSAAARHRAATRRPRRRSARARALRAPRRRARA